MMPGPSEIILDRARVREVAGVFHSVETLKAAGADLLLAGFDRSDVDVIAPPDEVLRKLGTGSNYVPAEELADIPGVPRQPFLAEDDIRNFKIVVASTVGSLAAGLSALFVFLSGGTTMQIGMAAILVGLAAGGVGLGTAPRLLGQPISFQGLAPSAEARSLIMWVRVRSDEQESQAREILLAHGADAVRVHEIEIVKTPEDLPLGSLRPDPWFGSERLGQP
jgi:hypothetical protein